MTRFEHNGAAYMQINGKDYLLLHAYCDTRRGAAWLFVQVVGETPLLPSDLDDKYKLLHTKTSVGRISTAYLPAAFAYRITDPVESAKASGPGGEVSDPEADDDPQLTREMAAAERDVERQLLFVGLTQEAAIALAARFMAEWCGVAEAEPEKMAQARRELSRGLRVEIGYRRHNCGEWLKNQGNLKTQAYWMEIGGWKLQKDKAKVILFS